MMCNSCIDFFLIFQTGTILLTVVTDDLHMRFLFHYNPKANKIFMIN